MANTDIALRMEGQLDQLQALPAVARIKAKISSLDAKDLDLLLKDAMIRGARIAATMTEQAIMDRIHQVFGGPKHSA